MIRKCGKCSREFKTKLSQVLAGKGKYCSRKCFLLSRMKRISVVCDKCKMSFEIQPAMLNHKKGRFCSKDCQHSWHKEHYEHSQESKKKISDKLSGKYIGEKHWCWKGGASLKHYSRAFNKKLKEKIKAVFDYKCGFCGETNYSRLCIHHIDGNGKNNDKKNLIALCPSCHGVSHSKYSESIMFNLLQNMNACAPNANLIKNIPGEGRR